MFIVDMFMFVICIIGIIIHLVKFKCWSWVPLHEHVTAGGLVWKFKYFATKIQILLSISTFHRSIFLLDLHNPGRPGLSDGLQRDGGFVQPPLPLGLLVPGGVLAAPPPLQRERVRTVLTGRREREVRAVSPSSLSQRKYRVCTVVRSWWDLGEITVRRAQN